MSYTYAERKRASGGKADAARQSVDAERLNALARGAVKPSAAELGHRVDLPEAMRAKMESSFGADLSAVRLYESQSVADAGAEAITQGSSIAFAPGKLDLTSSGGQALLGHELSHVVSQARGEVTGGGFLNDRALEARADREGAMAARGESVADAYGGAVAPLSTVSAAPAAGPMQAKRNKQTEQEEYDQLSDLRDETLTGKIGDQYTKKKHKRLLKLKNKFLDSSWRKARWSRAQRKANKLGNQTGLSQNREDILAREQDEMASLISLDDEEDDLPVEQDVGYDPDNILSEPGDSPLNTAHVIRRKKRKK